jgi:general secretion pathway protein G
MLKPCRRASRAFTLVELLTVIGIIAVLAAILFPVFATARAKARQTTCVSNLKQIGLAVQMYAQDYDGQLPYALDASDISVTSMWSLQPPACFAAITEMKNAGQILHWHRRPANSGTFAPGVLDTYIKGREVWRCPADKGFEYLDNNDSCGGPCPMPSHPTMHEAHGASYLYHTSIALAQRDIDTLEGTTRGTRRKVGPAEINLLFDGNGSWHGGPFTPLLGRSGLRYVTLFVDGHAKLLTWEDYNEAWNVDFSPSSGSPCP